MAVTHGGRIYQAARELQCDWREILDFSASINPLGPAPGVRKALTESFDQIAHYPDPYASTLQHALAREWDTDPQRIIVGNGATELIHFLARVWRTKVALALPVFSEFERAYPHAAHISATEAWPSDGLVVVTNPVNPTGAEAIIPDRDGLTLVDESFLDFTSLPSRMKCDNTLVLRSLTKFYALPGLRVGALVVPESLARELRPLREPWQVNVLAEAAALESLADKDHQDRTRQFIRSEQQRLATAFASIAGVTLHPTLANFYMVSLPYSAQVLCEFMRRQKILLRNCAHWPGVSGEVVRFAIRTQEENDRLICAWRSFPCD